MYVCPDIPRAETAGVFQQMLGLPQSLRPSPQLGRYRLDLLLVVGRWGQMPPRDQHRFGIQRRLGVVALLEPPPDTGRMRDSSS